MQITKYVASPYVGWQRSFEALRSDGRLFVAPILQILIFPQAPQQTLEWADRVAEWEFQRIIACHFDAPVAANPHQFRQAFTFLEQTSGSPGSLGSSSSLLPPDDFGLIKELEAGLVRSGIAKPAKARI